MKLYEFIFLILAIVSLIDYIITTIAIYQYKELCDLFGLRIEVQIKRELEILIILITIIIFLYKVIF
jgi:hypothetical protein